MAQVNIYTQQIVVGQDDIDMQRRVSNLRYVAWMQDVAVAHSAACGWPMERYESIGQGWVVRQHTITYKRPAFMGDVITAATWIAAYASRRSVRLCPLCGLLRTPERPARHCQRGARARQTASV